MQKFASLARIPTSVKFHMKVYHSLVSYIPVKSERMKESREPLHEEKNGDSEESPGGKNESNYHGASKSFHHETIT